MIHFSFYPFGGDCPTLTVKGSALVVRLFGRTLFCCFGRESEESR